MKVKMLIVLVLLLSAMAEVRAQETDPPCELNEVLSAEYKGMVEGEWLESVITTLQANIEDDDSLNFLSTGRELRKILARLDANCRALLFNTENDGQRPVLGPISLESGLWRVTFTTAGFGSVRTETLSGDCGTDTYLFNAFQGDAADGSEIVYETGRACEVLIEISNTSEPWELSFELLKATEQ